MMGYYKRPDLTEETVKDGWLHTGDIGLMVDGKYLKITDRKKEIFKTSGGKFVAPQPIENKMVESSWIEQIMVVGADQKFAAALIVPAFHLVKDWCQKNEVSVQSNEDVIRNPLVLQQFKDIVEEYNKCFSHVEQIKKFELLPEEWSIEGGELTPTMKLKRKIIAEKYSTALHRIYS
jgi:long-chain acyl-CoA synthetase